MSMWAYLRYKAKLEDLAMTKEVELKVFVPKCLYFECVLTVVARSMLGS